MRSEPSRKRKSEESQSKGNTAGDRKHIARGHFDRLLQLFERIFLNEWFSPEAMLHRMS